MAKIKITIVIDKVEYQTADGISQMWECNLTSAQKLFFDSFNGLPQDTAPNADLLARSMVCVAYEEVPRT